MGRRRAGHHSQGASGGRNSRGVRRHCRCQARREAIGTDGPAEVGGQDNRSKTESASTQGPDCQPVTGDTPSPALLKARCAEVSAYPAETEVPSFRPRVVCAKCGSPRLTCGRIETLNDFYASQVKQRSSGL